ncbi:MAG TPA: bifunctional riboflavin kinase/FAD synthetase [Solirubrobacteraceae bacterium]|jgi:riboflavin kinase/FMN adenylyltransferase
MEVTWLPDVERRPRRVAVGDFDGVHLGHREVIRGADTVLTFEPHPREVISPRGAPRLLTSLERKAELLEDLGVSELVVVAFDRAFAHRSAEDFVTGVLVEALEATHVSVGENFRFGHQAKGTPELLAADPRFTTRIVPLVEAEDEIVSSSHIRGLILAGEVAEAATLLGDPLQLRGTVVHGDERGRTLGYPTANLVPDERYVYPAHGVYAARAEVPDRGAWTAAVNVGVRPTFVTGRGVLVEAYLLDFQGDLYGSELRLEFLARLRGERRFETVEALVEQMGRDVEDTRRAATLDRP